MANKLVVKQSQALTQAWALLLSDIDLSDLVDSNEAEQNARKVASCHTFKHRIKDSIFLRHNDHQTQR